MNSLSKLNIFKSNKFFYFVLLPVLIVNLFLFFITHRDIFTRKFDVSTVEKIYQNSQYNVQYNEFKGWIDDDDLYSLAGIRYIAFDDP